MKPGVRLRIPKPPSEIEETFKIQIDQLHLAPYEREYAFDETRGWQFDFAWPAQRVAVEIEGYAHRGSEKRFREDTAKYNAAACLGWTLLRFTRRAINDWSAAEYVKAALAERTEP